MDAVNLRRWDMAPKKRRSHRDLRPETTTGARWTNIVNAAASARFSIGERVAWDEGSRILLGIVEAFTNDQHMLIVRMENGASATWPTVSARLRRVQTPDRPDSVSEIMTGSVATHVEATPTPVDDTLVPIGEPARDIESDYYETIDTVTSGELDPTMPGGSSRWRR